METGDILKELLEKHGFVIRFENRMCYTLVKEKVEIDLYKNISYLTFKNKIKPIENKQDIENFISMCQKGELQ